MENGEGLAWKGYSHGIQIDDRIGYPPSRYNTLAQILRQIEAESIGESVQFSERFDEESSERVNIKLQDNRKLGIAILGQLKQHPRISAFRQFLEGWYLSYFTPAAARGLPLVGPQQHLNVRGSNLSNVVQFMEREHPARFEHILKKISLRIPGIDRIDTESSPDGRLLLRFNDKGFEDPFFSQQVSDGTLKLFAYLLMLEDPRPHPLICIEEPENGLYPELPKVLIEEVRFRTRRG